MSSQSLPAKKAKTRAGAREAADAGPPPDSNALRLFDALLLVAFLSLTFLLGVFPLKDTDFWWHLRTGDLIRQSGAVPTADHYTYTVEGQPWVDLHWLFQVAVSLVYEHGGVRALNLAKCGVTCLAVLLLVTARRRDWPLWAMLAAWLPALLVLGGRMYVRPETLSLLYLSVFLAVLVRVDRVPWLALVLPLVQLAWVNTQGLFVIGPILLGAALVDAALRPGSFSAGRRPWWRVVGLATVLTGLACLVNPYGLSGALYPLQLARTMGNPVFSHWIAELTPIPLFIRRDGFISLPLRLHLFVMTLGAFSFLVPIVWLVITRLRPTTAPENAPKSGPPAKAEKKARGSKKASRAAEPPAWRLSPFRLILFLAFSLLSWQATRNSHQFAAVVGAVTAWNLGEWAAAVRRRSWAGGGAATAGPGVVPRLAALLAVAGVFGWVTSGRFYEATREGRTIGLGEQPLWYPHEAVKFSGGGGMPGKFLAYHIGHASLYEYYFGPKKKVYADARLEVIGADLFERYMELQGKISRDAPGWSRELDDIGRPAVLTDLENNADVGASLLLSPDWRCVWFDPVAMVFVHASYHEVVAAHGVDFGGRHFHPEPASEPRGESALIASAKGLRNLANFAGRAGPARVVPLTLLGMDHARRVGLADPDRADPWKLLGLFEILREPLPATPVPRFRLPFDPVFDLSAVRATYALKKALDAAPDDFLTTLMLTELYRTRGMDEEVLPLLDRLVGLTPINRRQTEEQDKAEAKRMSLRASLSAAPGFDRTARWENLSELKAAVNGLLAAGRAGTAADYLETAVPHAVRSWDETDRIATLRLHLGQPGAARKLWQGAPSPPRPAVRDARVALTELVGGDFEAARDGLRRAIAAEPDLFEAHYGLAVLEQDAGRAADALAAARKAVSLAPNDVARSAAQAVVAVVTPYASSPIADDKGR